VHIVYNIGYILYTLSGSGAFPLCGQAMYRTVHKQ